VEVPSFGSSRGAILGQLWCGCASRLNRRASDIPASTISTDSDIEERTVTYVIAQPCVDLKDRACVEECPVDCIYEGKRMLYIHPDECVDCGACEPVCPVEAIFYEDDTPDEWKEYYNANVDFFSDLGSPGGAAKTGVIDKDHPLVAALPPQEHEE
jgi:NAD-dependent dihydropyrimidine dehydrogenase PreA subunit